MTQRPGFEIWSGGQTGVDRAALDAAIELRIPYGGWIPAGRGTEDGPLDARYEGMRETATPRLDVRTRRNVRECDATLVITFGPVSGGTALALRTAQRLARPHLVIDMRADDMATASRRLRVWLHALPRPLRLNVAGPRASSVPEAYEATRELLRALAR